MAEAPFDVQKAHRWFAVELNNVAWDLVESGGRSAADAERMVQAAHAACYHWLQVGAPINHQRAQCLIATAYAAAGRAEPAVYHADRCLALGAQTGDAQTAFDRATAYGCAARAYALARRDGEARSLYQKALEAAAGLDDPEDRKVFDRLYPSPT